MIPDCVHRGANGNVPSNVMSVYDKAIRDGCLGLKQHIHWHAPQQKSILRRFSHYRSQETTKSYQQPMPPRFCKPTVYMKDAFTLSVLINWLQQNKISELRQTIENPIENNEHRPRLGLDAVPNTVLSNTQGVWPASSISCYNSTKVVCPTITQTTPSATSIPIKPDVVVHAQHPSMDLQTACRTSKHEEQWPIFVPSACSPDSVHNGSPWQIIPSDSAHLLVQSGTLWNFNTLQQVR
ncbi:hypothetical protein AHF37_03226 [Paragonimus kellicotti]|nr:hypothetical protein AHF37_03226 [Paragonimus kellicotti]